LNHFPGLVKMIMLATSVPYLETGLKQQLWNEIRSIETSKIIAVI